MAKRQKMPAPVEARPKVHSTAADTAAFNVDVKEVLVLKQPDVSA
jgi:hypothetical protein